MELEEDDVALDEDSRSASVCRLFASIAEDQVHDLEAWRMCLAVCGFEAVGPCDEKVRALKEGPPWGSCRSRIKLLNVKLGPLRV